MKKKYQQTIVFAVSAIFLLASCKKENSYQQSIAEQPLPVALAAFAETPPFNIEVILRGDGKRFGLIKFRQDNDPEKIITLDTWVRDLAPNHNYLLQRAVDTQIDGNCTSISWLTLGKGLVAQSILTNANGTGREELWRNVSAVPSGSKFDIHFRVLDATNMSTVLTSDCYQYVVR